MRFVSDFDLRTAIYTLLLAPIAYFLLRRLASFLRSILQRILNAAIWVLERKINRSLSIRTSLRQYCKTQLNANATKYLQVPGKASVALETDRIFVPLTLEFGGAQAGIYSHSNLTDAGNRVRVVGDPGSGKSSLIKRVFRDACHSLTFSGPHHEPLPIAIELKPFPPTKSLAKATDEK